MLLAAKKEILHKEWRRGSAAGYSLGLGAADLVTPSALRTTGLVYPGSLNPIAGCAQDHSHGESHPSTHSPPSPLRRLLKLT